MRIERIKLYNISSYSGMHEFDLSVNGDRSIVLIGGQNGTGKTSLFTAIKLALYGPLCFRFQSKNNQYSARIKELISHDVFAQAEVRAFIELEITLPRGPQAVRYTVRREWYYVGQKLEEKDSVWEEKSLLDEKELNFFQNYLYHVIPPNLFDFFFFDGEEIAGFFAAPNYHTYLRDAVLTLEHYDTFGLIEKYCRRYTVSEEESGQAKKRREEYEAVCDELEQADQIRQTNEQNALELAEKKQRLEQELEDLKEGFRKAGGIRREELQELQGQITRLEKSRDQINLELKNFVEELAPLVLTAPVAKQLRKQLSLEQKVKQYQAICQQLTPDRLSASLSGLLSTFGVTREKEFIGALSSALETSVKPNIDTDHFVFLHDLSQEQRDAVGVSLGQISQFCTEQVVGQLRRKDKISKELSELRVTLENVLSPEAVLAYEARLTKLEEEIKSCKVKEKEAEQKKLEFEKRLGELEARRRTLRSVLVGTTGKIEAVEYADRMSHMMRGMLDTLLDRKRKEIETETLRLSKKILRKEHFIDLVELNEKFDFSLYRRQKYTYEELVSLFTNIGPDELSRRIGVCGMQRLQEQLGVASLSELRKLFRRDASQPTLFDGKCLELYKRIEFQQLSKGEKQVFILSLYWAIIKTSGRDIPFIIDTPYARIDTEHREQIAKNFFPDVSGQVIILSTDEEITAPYYDALRPHIAQEYTLSYNEELGQTQVVKGYSFGGNHQ